MANNIKLVKIEDEFIYFTDGKSVFVEGIVWSEDGWKVSGVSYIGTSEGDLHKISDNDLLALAGYTADYAKHREKFLSVGCRRYGRYVQTALGLINTEYDAKRRIQYLDNLIFALICISDAVKAADGKMACAAYKILEPYGVRVFVEAYGYARIQYSGQDILTCLPQRDFLHVPDGRKREYFYSDKLEEKCREMAEMCRKRTEGLQGDLHAHAWLEKVNKIQALQEEIAAIKQGMASDTLTLAAEKFHI